MTEYRNTRPDSPKGKVWIAFDTKGEEAARKLGDKLGLAAHKVARWIKDDGAGFLPKPAKGEGKTAKKNGKAVEAKAKKNGKAPVEAKAAPAKAKKPVKKAA